MDEQITNQLNDSVAQLAGAAEALQSAVAQLTAQHQELSAKVERIVAAIDERMQAAPEPGRELQDRVAELERANADLKAQAARLSRKTLSPLVSSLLAKNTGESQDAFDAAVLDKALGALSTEQRIAVKAELARAGLIL